MSAPKIPNPVTLSPPCEAPNPCAGVTIRYQMFLIAPMLYQECDRALYEALRAACIDLYKIGVRCLYTQGILNVRKIKGTNRWSKHATGEAVDICGVFLCPPRVKLTVKKHRMEDIEPILRKHFKRVIGPREDPEGHRGHFHCEI